MPIYEFTCDDCGQEFEQLIASMGDKAPCPNCESKNVSRKFSTFAAHNQASGGSKCADGGCPMSGGCCGGACPME